MARPPVIRRTTSQPWVSRRLMSTSVKGCAQPSERQGGSQAYKRKVGRISLHSTCSRIASSTAMFHAPHAGGVVMSRQVVIVLFYIKKTGQVLLIRSEEHTSEL